MGLKSLSELNMRYFPSVLKTGEEELYHFSVTGYSLPEVRWYTYERLLTRYYDGETSDTEEKELKRFFTEEDVPAHLLAEKEIFMQLAAHPAPEIPEGLESRLSRKIDEWDTGERRTLKIKKHTRVLRLQWIGSIAASLLILLSVGLYLYKPYPAPQDTCATPEEAYAQAQKALIMLSSSLNKGIEKVESVQEATGKIQENVNEQLNRLNNIKQ